MLHHRPDSLHRFSRQQKASTAKDNTDGNHIESHIWHQFHLNYPSQPTMNNYLEPDPERRCTFRWKRVRFICNLFRSMLHMKIKFNSWLINQRNLCLHQRCHPHNPKPTASNESWNFCNRFGRTKCSSKRHNLCRESCGDLRDSWF